MDHHTKLVNGTRRMCDLLVHIAIVTSELVQELDTGGPITHRTQVTRENLTVASVTSVLR